MKSCMNAHPNHLWRWTQCDSDRMCFMWMCLTDLDYYSSNWQMMAGTGQAIKAHKFSATNEVEVLNCWYVLMLLSWHWGRDLWQSINIPTLVRFVYIAINPRLLCYKFYTRRMQNIVGWGFLSNTLSTICDRLCKKGPCARISDFQ